MRRQLFALLLLFAAPCVSAQPCPASCPTADDVAVQALLDTVAAAGGGFLRLGARVYTTCSPLLVGPNTHFRGAGRGATIIRGGAVRIKKPVGALKAGATIASVGSANVTISDLTVDHATCGRPDNGVEVFPADSIHTGTVPENILITNIEVIGSGNPAHHAYMIWNFKGRNVKIVNNWVDGRASSASPQEGIESFGGYDVLISGNTVKNIGSAGINLGSADVGNSETEGITVSDNYVTGSGVGINLGTSNAVHGPQGTAHIRMTGNTILASRMTGIDIVAAPGTVMRDITISDNTIRNLSGNGVVGIRMRTNTGALLAGESVIANNVSGNHIENVRGASAHGIRVTNYPNVRVTGNTITGVDDGGIHLVSANDAEIVRNRIEDGGVSPIQMHGTFARFMIDGNRIRWGGPSGAITVLGGNTGTIRGNVFIRTDGAQPPAIVLGGDTCGVTTAGNEPWYWPAWPGVSSPACP